ncbi:MAG: MFS transporter [Mycobacteriaceae bacterium]
MTTETTTPQSATTTSPTWRQWTALGLMAVPLFMMATDFTAIFLAIPDVGADLQPTTTQMLWMVHTGELVAAGTLITMGWVTGRTGPRRLLLLSLLVYAIASTMAAVAPTAEMFLAARVLIGLATAAASPASFAMLRALFTDSRHHAVGFAVLMGAFTVGTALGPPMTGLLLDHFWWGSVFLVNVPVAAVALVLGLRLFADTGERTTDRIDVTSVVLSVSAVTLLVFGLQELADSGFAVTYAVAVATGIVLGAVFLHRQRRIPNPLLDLDLFSSRTMRVTVVFFILATIAFVSNDFVIVQYLQIVAGINPGTLGLILALPGVSAALSTAAAPALINRFSPASVMAIGSGVAVSGSVLVLAGLTVAPSTALIAAGMTVTALGMSPPMVVGAQLMITSVEKRHAGPVASVQDISGSLGATLGIMVVGSVSMAVFGRMVTDGAPESLAESDVGSATDSPGAAVAVAEQLGQDEGNQLLSLIDDALSQGTAMGLTATLAVGVATTLLVARGLRGVRMPDDDHHR